MNPKLSQALADGFDGSGICVGPNHSTIELWYDTGEQAIAARRVILSMIDDALASQAAPEQPEQPDSFHLSGVSGCAATAQLAGKPLSEARQEQARQQCLAVVHMAKALQEVHEARALILERSALDLTEQIGESTAYIMESLGDMLSNMDAVDSAEDEWLDPVFEAAHTMWPQSLTPGPADNAVHPSDDKEVPAVSALPKQGWQPIETAPNDCEIVGAEWQSPGDNYPMDLITQTTMFRNGKWRYPSGISWSPSHWMPIPPPPVEGEQQ